MSRVIGCGIDVEELSRFDRHTGGNDDALLSDICTEREISNICGDERVCAALRFSCKEAFFKALGRSWTNSSIGWKEIELLFIGPGLENFRVEVHGYAGELLSEKNARIGETSFDFNDEVVIFTVILLQDRE